MEHRNLLSKRKIILISLIFFYIILAASIILENIIPELSKISIFIIIVIFILSQYFNINYRYLILLALLLIVVSPILLIKEYDKLSEDFTVYAYYLLASGVIILFFEHARKKLKKKVYLRVLKIMLLSLLVLLLLAPILFYRNYIPKIPSIIKNYDYYIKREEIIINDEKIKENILITVENPTADAEISGYIKIYGWAIETNSLEDSGIDKIDIFIDGKPGIGMQLAENNFIKNVKDYNPLEKFIFRLHEECFNQTPEDKDIYFWIYKIGTGKDSINNVARYFWLSEEYSSRDLSNEAYVYALYKVILNRKPDNIEYDYWSIKLDDGSERTVLLEEFLNSVEFKSMVRDYYDINISELIEGINLPREGVEDIYGKQFRMSGFNIGFNSTQFVNGEHIVYVFAYNQYFGWDYANFNITINN